MIYDDIINERKRQTQKWGAQKLPMTYRVTPQTCLKMAENYKVFNDFTSIPSWHDILMEEIYEAFAGTDPAKQREELIQAAAVIVQIIEGIDNHHY